MGPEAKKKLQALKAQLPSNIPDIPTETDREKLKAVLDQITGIMDVVHDLCVDKPKETKEEFIQLILVEANKVIDRTMIIAKDDKIEFSFQGMDVQYLGGNEDQPTLVHPDTERANDLERDRDRNWDSSSRDCPGD